MEYHGIQSAGCVCRFICFCVKIKLWIPLNLVYSVTTHLQCLCGFFLRLCWSGGGNVCENTKCTCEAPSIWLYTPVTTERPVRATLDYLGATRALENNWLCRKQKGLCFLFMSPNFVIYFQFQFFMENFTEKIVYEKMKKKMKKNNNYMLMIRWTCSVVVSRG